MNVLPSELPSELLVQLLDSLEGYPAVLTSDTQILHRNAACTDQQCDQLAALLKQGSPLLAARYQTVAASGSYSIIRLVSSAARNGALSVKRPVQRDWFDVWREINVPGIDRGIWLEHLEWMQRFDWQNTPLGPVQEWPEAWLTVTAQALAAPYPVLLALGDKLCMVYNQVRRSSTS